MSTRSGDRCDVPPREVWRAVSVNRQEFNARREPPGYLDAVVVPRGQVPVIPFAFFWFVLSSGDRVVTGCFGCSCLLVQYLANRIGFFVADLVTKMYSFGITLHVDTSSPVHESIASPSVEQVGYRTKDAPEKSTPQKNTRRLSKR